MQAQNPGLDKNTIKFIDNSIRVRKLFTHKKRAAIFLWELFNITAQSNFRQQYYNNIVDHLVGLGYVVTKHRGDAETLIIHWGFWRVLLSKIFRLKPPVYKFDYAEFTS